MSKYIDADRLVELIYAEKEYLSKRREYGAEHILMHHFYPLVDELSVVDVAEVVRCAHCIYWDRETLRHQFNDFRDWNEAECKVLAERDGYNEINRYTEGDDYCSRGERKDG